MIKANELRIGNRLWPLRVLDPENIPLMGYEISAGHIAYSEVELNNDWGAIPLTTERLESMGFEMRLKYWEPFVGDAKGAWYHRGDLFLVVLKSSGKVYRAIATNGDEFGYVDGPEIVSLHQLQNLYFALNGEELTVKEMA
jgi:hypothetical protein